MDSIRILTTYKILDITNIEISANFIKARGDDFARTKFVLINGELTTDFALVGDAIYIYPPEKIDVNDVKTLVVIAEAETVNEKALLNLGVGYAVRPLSGVERVVQLFVFTLLTSPGSYILDQSKGGGLMDVMRRGGGAQASVVLPDVVASIRKTETDIKNMQAGLSLPAEELLLAVNVIDTSIRSSDQAINVFVELVTLNGSRRAFNLGV
jgi:hypothetical protein